MTCQHEFFDDQTTNVVSMVPCLFQAEEIDGVWFPLSPPPWWWQWWWWWSWWWSEWWLMSSKHDILHRHVFDEEDKRIDPQHHTKLMDQLDASKKIGHC